MADPVSLGEFESHLNLSASTSESDVELTLHLRAATEAIEKRIGPIITREFTERLSTYGGGRLLVSRTPLVSVVSIINVATGVTWTAEKFDIDPAGIITGIGRRLSMGRYDVTYTAGRGATAREDHKLAILYVAEHLWEMQQGSGVGGRPGLYGDTGPTGEESARFYYRGFALPRRALELIAGDEEIAIG
jgi:hypothetical protein